MLLVVFCDVDPISWNMTLDNVKEKISQNTKAILMVHTFGLPAQAEEIEEFCKENKIFLIEDEDILPFNLDLIIELNLD